VGKKPGDLRYNERDTHVMCRLKSTSTWFHVACHLAPGVPPRKPGKYLGSYVTVER